ncbi:hypothetical protein M413DRAFT_445417 [Hebeloma cylindrosporum]|uniref:Uncharacterized protein n=1 Tax=Hebeloma cylindrosporum TaxID=76867 RepID=A0A0C3BXS5_HEBCY|nr:hypothetical protein M413DRAFT_445417 [Hebeloma cylindrosporum h7]
MSSKITISRPIVRIRPVQRKHVFLKARDERCSALETLSERLYGYEKRIRAMLPSSRDTNSKPPDILENVLPLILLPITCSARTLEFTSPVYKRLRYPLISTVIAQLLYLTILLVFPQFTIILSTAVVAVILNLRSLALVYKLLLSNMHSFLYRLESRLAACFTSLQASLDKYLGRLVTNLEEKASRSRNLDLTNNIVQILPVFHSSSLPKIPLLYPRGGLDTYGELQRNPPAAAAHFDTEGWLLVCDPELGLPSRFEQDATPEPSRKSSPILHEKTVIEPKAVSVC